MTRPNLPGSADGHFIAPPYYQSGPGILAQTGSIARRYGSNALIIHGQNGFPIVAAAVRSSLASAQLTVTERSHVGPCTQAAILDHARTGSLCVADLIIGIGGGRVLDTAKAVAGMLGLPCITVPTSAATCSAVTAVVVYYDPDGVYLESRVVGSPVAALVDFAVLSAAPGRLLVAGIIDALAKCHEVRFAVNRAPQLTGTALAALALCDRLEALLQDAGPAAQSEAGLQLIAEAALLWPGLIGGLAGEAAKLAAAHSIHNALTLLPGSRQSLHGEILAFGILVQMLLEGRDVESVRRMAGFFARLGCPAGLEALGCGAFLSGRAAEVASRASAFKAMLASFPQVSAAELQQVMLTADSLAVSACA